MSIRGVSPVNSIKKAFAGTKYEALIPYVIAQAKHETGNFTSAAYRQNNNLFGMGRPSSRSTLDNRDRDNRTNGPLITEGQVMANFDSVSDSAKDLMLWFDMFRQEPFPTEVSSAWEYAAALKNRNPSYYTDSIENYSKGLGSWI